MRLRDALDAHMSETDFQRVVVELARLEGWLVHHTRPARTKEGWRTPIQGDAGFPDLVLVRPPRLIFAELKVKGRRFSQAQEYWRRALLACRWPTELHDRGIPQVCLWTPALWDTIVETLKRRPT